MDINKQIEEQFPGAYLKALDINYKPTIATVKYALVEIVGRDDPQEKFVIYFEEFVKPMIPNKTNMATMRDLLGVETDTWAGQKVTLFSIKVNVKGELKDGIRIREADGQLVEQVATQAKLEAAPVEL